MKKQLAKLKKVPLKTVWPHEASDFTNWLAEQENIDILSDAINMDITHLRTEAEVGRFKLDILAVDGSGRKIIIENQLEKTDHKHLGQIITYASGYDAETIIWIVEDVHEEHRKSIEWLNKNTDRKLNFFLIKIEVLQIEDSPYAPKFVIVESPNECPKTNTDTQLKQLEFWKGFKEFAQEKNIPHH